MTKWSWEKNVSCMIGELKEGNERPEVFARSWRGRLWAVYWRVPIFVWSLAIIGWSATSFWSTMDKFMLYMTHWGLLLILFESFFGIIVAIKEYNISADSPEPVHMEATGSQYGSFVDETIIIKNVKAAFPWYLKVYWILYNVTIPVAFLVTVFYWAILNTPGKQLNYAPNPVLDVMIHGVNSLVMLVELVLSAHPSRLLHIMQCLYFALVYLIFTAIYYGSGGLDPWGHAFIYPVIDWSKPEQTLVVAVLTGLFLALMHVLTVAIAAVRDLISKRCFISSPGVYNDGFEA